MKILFNTYPAAFQTPGGGEVQLLQYEKYISKLGLEVTLFDQWNPNLKSFDLVHFFSCMPGSENFLHYIKLLGIPLIVSPNLWITKKTKKIF